MKRRLITKEELETINRYLQDKLNGNELSDFRRRIEEDPVLKEKVMEVQLSSLSMKGSERKRILREYHKMIKNKLKERGRDSCVTQLGVVTSLILVFSLLFWLTFF